MGGWDLGLGLAWPCDIGSPMGWPHAWTVGERPPSITSGGWRCGTRRPLHAMWVVGSRSCAPPRRRVVAASLVLGLGLRVGFLLVGEPSSLMPRA